MKGIVRVMAAASLTLLHTPVAAQAQQKLPARQGTAALVDLNEVVCEKQNVIGSRLVVKKICKTRAEWALQRQADRMDVEKAQVRRPM